MADVTEPTADVPYEELPADSALGLVRALIPDIELLSDPHDITVPDSYLFGDATLERYLLIESGNVKRAAADACEALGSSELLILKKITSDDLATDGPNVAKEYGAKATRLRTQADNDDDRADEGDHAQFVRTPFLKRPISFDPMRRRGF